MNGIGQLDKKKKKTLSNPYCLSFSQHRKHKHYTHATSSPTPVSPAVRRLFQEFGPEQATNKSLGSWTGVPLLWVFANRPSFQRIQPVVFKGVGRPTLFVLATLKESLRAKVVNLTDRIQSSEELPTLVINVPQLWIVRKLSIKLVLVFCRSKFVGSGGWPSNRLPCMNV